MKSLLILIAMILSSSAFATTIHAPSCYGTPNVTSPYYLTFEKRADGNLSVVAHEHGRSRAIVSANRPVFARMNPDLSMAGFGGKVIFTALPLPRLARALWSGGEAIAEALESMHSPHLEERDGLNGYQLSRWQICLRRIYSGLPAGKAVALSYADAGDFDWARDAVKETILDH